MESPNIRREADDSYRGWSRWGRFMNPPGGGSFIADFIGRKRPLAIPRLAFGTSQKAISDDPMCRETSYRDLRSMD
jgi:hypothetical protein